MTIVPRKYGTSRHLSRMTLANAMGHLRVCQIKTSKPKQAFIARQLIHCLWYWRSFEHEHIYVLTNTHSKQFSILHNAKFTFSQVFVDETLMHLPFDASCHSISIYCKHYFEQEQLKHNIEWGVDCNVHSMLGYCTYYTQLKRFFRLCNNINDFLFRANFSYSKLVIRGYKHSLLLKYFKRFCSAYNIKGEYGEKIRICSSRVYLNTTLLFRVI